MSGTFRRLAGVGVAVLLASLTAALTAPAAQAIPAQRGAGFVWADQPSAASYTPSPTYQYNSSAAFQAVNTITRSGVGSYTVAFPNLGITGGTAHVTAYQGGTEQCKVASWFPSGGTQFVNVRCFSLNGSPADSYFTASYTNVLGSSYRPFGYVWANNPTAASYTPSTTYQTNSTGALNTISRSGVGSYTVHLPGIGASAGHVQVTAYGSGTERCKTAGWGPSGTTQTISVRCFNQSGAPADTFFTLTYAERINILGLSVCCSSDGHPSAYAWAHAPTSASYVPSTTYQFNDFTNTAATASRSGVGAYGMKFAHANLGVGNVQVTAYGSGPEFCKVHFWNPNDGIQTRCYNAAGAPVDTLYDVAFTGPFVIG